ncbi:hypothetical protein QE418_003389 [Microbacterium testaceum]|uniref:hypothetical protein n=1 Tax=Microbacterium TaxID=33882 RepID=UPI00278189CA|nr:MULTISPECIES: hypothetical protein [Microbacterium]MDQ1113941.1 hypothetical protein [Microbacterium testaceum]MDR6098952.1 hypothetical protein [Microbacterium sp. SORGH_AS_0454]
MTGDERRATVLIDTVAAQRTSLVDMLLRVLLGFWVPFRWANDPDMVNAWAARSAVDVDTALAQARRLARAFQVEQLRMLDALPPTLPPVQDVYPRANTAIVEVYKRPARQYEHAIREGATPEQAERIFVDRLERIVEADVSAAMRDEKDRVRKAAPKVIGYRRVLRPEKSKYGPCGLCVVAADRIYKSGDLLELHDRCVCETQEITEGSDLGRSLNRAELDELYLQAGSMFAEELKRIRVTIRENGELGPVLVRSGREFKDAERVAKESTRGGRDRKPKPYKTPTVADDSAKWAAMRRTSERSIEILEDAKRRGTNMVSLTEGGTPHPVKDLDVAIDYHRSLIAKAKSHGA